MLLMREEIIGGDKLFCLEDGSSPTAQDINNLIRNLCAFCGLDPQRFRSHQLRSGGVKDYLTAGVPDSIIQEMARWRNLDSMVPYKKLASSDIAEMLRKYCV